MARGITISNHLSNGDPEGVIFSYMSNWSGQAIKIPRNLFAQSGSLPELQRPGVYFLLGESLENPDDKLVYIGEANNLFERVSYQLRDIEKSFVETIVCFCSQTETLTVSHTKYLEKKIIGHVSKSSSYRITNRKDGNAINLPRMVQDEMDTFFDNMRIVLPTLGYSLLHIENTLSIGKGAPKSDLFSLDVGGHKAKARLVPSGIEVQKGSEMKIEETPSLSGSYSNLRKTLLQNEIIKALNGKYIFVENYEFTSPSTAAAVILGYSVNGRVAWKNDQGKSLKDLEEEILNE